MIIGILKYNDTLCPLWSLVRKEETKCLGIKCSMFNTDSYVCSFRKGDDIECKPE